MFFAGMFCGCAGLLLFGWLFMKKQEKETAKQMQEMANKLKDEETIVNEEKGGEKNVD